MDCQKDTANNIKVTGKQYVKKKKKTYYLVCKKKTDNKKHKDHYVLFVLLESQLF